MVIWPVGHGVQDVCSAGLNVPGEQGVTAVLVHELPAGQMVQSVCVPLLYLPAGHAVHRADAAVENVPSAHGEHELGLAASGA